MKEKLNKKRKYRGLRIFAKILFGFIVFLLLVVLFIRSPWGQNIIKNKFIASITNETNTVIDVERVFLTFSGDVYIDGLYIEDENGDTLIYSNELEADIPLWGIIRGHGLSVNSVDWNGLRANIIREDTIEGYNFQFLIDAIMPADTTVVQKDTIQSQQFRLGEIHLSDFDVVYNDKVLGIESSYIIDELNLEMREMDLERMYFSAYSGNISNAVIDFKQIPFETLETAEEVPLPQFSIEDFQIDNVKIDYESVSSEMLANLNIREMLLDIPEANFEKNIFDINSLVLNKSNILIKTNTLNLNQASNSPEQIPEGFEWPNFNLKLNEISLNDNVITFVGNGKILNENKFDPQAFKLNNVDFVANDIIFENQKISADVDEFSLTSTGDIHLKKLQFNAALDNEHLSLDGLVLELNQNYLEGDLNFGYSSFNNFIENPENATVNLNIPRFNLLLSDFFKIQPSLGNNQYLKELSKKNLRGNLIANGTLASIKIPVANVKWGGSTSLVATGTINNATNMDNISFDFPKLKVKTTKTDINRFMKTDSLGFNLPEQLVLNASIKGNLKDVEGNANLNTSDGAISMEGSFSNNEKIAFFVNVNLTEFQLGKIAQIKQLGEINMSLTTSGEGNDINSLNGNLDANISSLELNNYVIQDMDITGEVEKGSGMVHMDYNDGNINVNMESFVVLDSVASKVNMDLDVIGVNLQRLGFTSRDIRAALEFDASFKGDFEAFDVNAEIIDGVAVYDQQSYLLGDFRLSGRVRPDSTALDIRNKIIDLELRSNTDPVSFANAMQDHFNSYLVEGFVADTVQNAVNLHLRAQIRQEPILDEVFFIGLKEMDTISIAVDFEEKERMLFASVDLPLVNYNNYEADSLSIRLDSNKDKFEFLVGFKEINGGPIALKETKLEGGIENERLQLGFNSFYKDQELIFIQSEIARINEDLVFSLDPSKVIFNSEIWEVPDNNQVVFADEFVQFQDFRLSKANQTLEILNRVSDGKNQIAIELDNFNLANILNYLNPDKILASGSLNGDFIIEDPYGSQGFVADLNIADLHLVEIPVGNLSLDARALGNNDYNFDLAIKEGNIDLDLEGRYYATETGPVWDTQLDLNKVEMIVVEGFSFGEITNTSGSFSGNIDLKGTFTEPVYSGQLNFDNAGFSIAMLNAPFVLPNETLTLTEEAVSFQDLNIQDKNGNVLTLNGKVLTESYLNPGFDVSFEAENFMALNSTKENNKLYYGTAVLDATGTLTGDLNLPLLDIHATVNSETDFTYVVPTAEVNMIQREGVVIFVNKENPDNILTETTEESFTLTGFAIDAVIDINEGSVVNVIINEETGDNLRVTGEGTLYYGILPNGRNTLSGRYEMSGGHYEMNFYGLVSRRFEIEEGSTIRWNGSPFDANLDIKASYEVETSASTLMEPQLSGADTSLRNRFRQQMPFIVYLNIEGDLASPELSFGLDMPESDQGSIGGQVYGRLQELNDQEQELNRQVFSLLVLNRFYPSSGIAGSGGGTLAIARDNLNNALSDQLNLLSNDLFQSSGFAIDFGIDSFTDYQGTSPTERTQLDIAAEKTFMDKRLIVRVGSEVDIQGRNPVQNERTPLIGNVSIEYLITEDGKFRIRGFRTSTYENVIDGQLMVNGIALLFMREFNKFSELWANMKEEEEFKQHLK